MEYFELNNGIKVPCLCFGPGMFTRGLKDPDSFLSKVNYKIKYKYRERNFQSALESAIENGYRFIDYSAVYSREDLIKKAIDKSGVSRNDFILTTRISNRAQSKNIIKEEFYKSLERFGVDYIDLLMFHWPVTDFFIKTWEQMLELKHEGLCRILGVSNCNIHHLDKLIKETGEIPSINQVEIHPLFTQKELLKFCKQTNIVLEAYTPLARMDERMTRLPKLKTIAQKYNKTITQIILRWHIQNGVIPVFRSLNKGRQKENIEIFDFSLSQDDMLTIDSININSRLRYDPDNCDFSIL